MTDLFANDLPLIHIGIVLLIISLFAYVARSVTENKWVWALGWGAMAVSGLSLIASITVRSQMAAYFALSNMYESLLVVAIGVIGGFLVVDRKFQRRSLGWPVALLALGTVAYATTLPMDIKPLQAALQSYWRSIHVPVILTSYALLTLSFITSVVGLFMAYFKPTLSTASSTGPAIRLPGFQDVTNSPAMIYDDITYRLIAVAFPLLAIGIILGGLWANEAWGNYWSWDPKESMSLVTLLAYGVYLHMRVNGSYSHQTLAWVSVVGFVMMLITYFGVNIMGVGLHSYGKIG